MRNNTKGQITRKIIQLEELFKSQKYQIFLLSVPWYHFSYFDDLFYLILLSLKLFFAILIDIIILFQQKFDRIVLDTAPTGHTLRMLQLPDFLQQLIGKLKKIRAKAGGLGDMMGRMGGMGGSNNNNNDDNMVSQEDNDKLEKFEKKMERLEEILHNPGECEFTVVTIPTEVASSETIRLLQSLKEESVAVRRVIINQVLPVQDNENSSSQESVDFATNAYLDRLRSGQKQSLQELQKLAEMSDTNLIQIPYFDMEVRTVYGLRVVGSAIFKDQNTAK